MPKKENPFAKQKQLKAENRTKVLTEISRGPVTLTALEEKTHLSRTVLLGHLGDLKKDGDIVRQDRIKGRSFALYQITEKGSEEISNIGEVVSLMLELTGNFAKNYFPRRSITELGNLAKEKPDLFMKLFELGTKLFFFSSSEDTKQWIGKHGLKGLESLAKSVAQSQLKQKGQRRVTETEEETIEALNRAVASLKETMGQNKQQ